MGENEDINKPPEGPPSSESPESSDGIVNLDLEDFDSVEENLAEVKGGAEEEIDKDSELGLQGADLDIESAGKIKASRAEALDTIEKEKEKAGAEIAGILGIETGDKIEEGEPEVVQAEKDDSEQTPTEPKAEIDELDSRLREIDVRQEELEKGGLKTDLIEEERAKLEAERAEIENKKAEIFAAQKTEAVKEGKIEAGPEALKAPENEEENSQLRDHYNNLKIRLAALNKIPATDLSEADKAQKEAMIREKDLVYSYIEQYERQREVKSFETEIQTIDAKIEAIKKKYPDGNMEAASEEEKAEMDSLLGKRRELVNKAEDGRSRLLALAGALVGLERSYNAARANHQRKEAEAEAAEETVAETAEAPSEKTGAVQEKKTPPKKGEVGKKVKSALGKGFVATVLPPILGVLGVSKVLNFVSKIAGWIDQGLEFFFSKGFVEKGQYWWNKLTLANYYKKKRGEKKQPKKT
ncbi:hypothetical protein KKF59_01400 [Patescibacteria group bacterium]|nr:hypothetical protein [Patescibacteria group bacterium]MBU1034316.1 hypothetical protein [Patescibacteria group bacterium]MBU1907770.1 hypothetical protein [Patescibacteria group bacterium]